MPTFAVAQNKIHFTSLGCPRNLVDSEVMLGILLKNGYEVTENLQEADYLVVNTCGFLESARQEAYAIIEEILEEKKPSAKLIVTGCMVQKQGDATLRVKYPDVHYFLGSGDAEKILEAVRAETSSSSVTSARSYLEAGEVPRQLSTPSHYAYLKIAEGCAKQCAFCIIPKIKGKLRSKTIERVLKEFHSLLNQGVKEIILIAQDLGDFGKDRKEKNGLAELLREMLKSSEEFWIRLLYLYPDEITDEIIEIIASDKRICRYLDMPIQHINDQILKAMHRKTNAAQIKATITALRRRLPEIVIRTSLMVGFPGETEEQFRELLTFVKEFALDNVGIFQYSKEEESYSANLPGHIDSETKQHRFEELAKAQAKVVKKRSRRFLGQRLEVIVEGFHPESRLLMTGRFYGQCPEIDGVVILNDITHVTAFGEKYLVEVTDIAGYDLIGRVIAKKQINRLSIV
jgi:ribosomal protein S12 methylthiotransferase